MWNQGLDSMILVGPLQLGIFCDSVTADNKIRVKKVLCCHLSGCVGCLALCLSVKKPHRGNRKAKETADKMSFVV